MSTTELNQVFRKLFNNCTWQQNTPDNTSLPPPIIVGVNNSARFKIHECGNTERKTSNCSLRRTIIVKRRHAAEEMMPAHDGTTFSLAPPRKEGSFTQLLRTNGKNTQLLRTNKKIMQFSRARSLSAFFVMMICSIMQC